MPICPKCNIEFENKGLRGPKKTYCSQKCYPSIDKRKAGLYHKTKICNYCKKDYKTYQWKSKYCSIDCANKAQAEKIVEKVKCKTCGKLFILKGCNRYGLTCSKRCADKYYSKNNPLTVISKGARYRAKKNGNKVEDVSFEYICERDGWMCQICGKKVSKRKKCPDPLSPSLDHILPISKGGEHSNKNTQLAHLKCNMSKNANGGYQLRLVG